MDHLLPKSQRLKELEDEYKMIIHRELTIVKLLCQEYNSGEIAKKLGLSTRTVDEIRNDLYERTNSRSVIGLVKYAIKHKIYTFK